MKTMNELQDHLDVAGYLATGAANVKFYEKYGYHVSKTETISCPETEETAEHWEAEPKIHFMIRKKKSKRMQALDEITTGNNLTPRGGAPSSAEDQGRSFFQSGLNIEDKND